MNRRECMLLIQRRERIKNQRSGVFCGVRDAKVKFPQHQQNAKQIILNALGMSHLGDFSIVSLDGAQILSFNGYTVIVFCLKINLNKKTGSRELPNVPKYKV